MTFSDQWQNESDEIRQARTRAQSIGATVSSPTAASVLTVLAASVGARAAVEIGAGAGISGLHLLNGMADDAVLTTIDSDSANQAAAKETFAAAGVESTRARQITGDPAEVLPRLADGAYDIVVINSIADDPAAQLEQAQRVLREGGVLVVSGFLGDNGQVADLAARDPRTMALRELGSSVKDNENLRVVLLPIDSGVLVASKTA